MKITIDGKVGIREPILDSLKSELVEGAVISVKMRHDIEDLVAQDDADEGVLFDIEISDSTFSTDDNPMVTISRGPISIAVSLVDLRRATAAFLDSGGVK